jgi:hypothetical protein
MQIHDSAAASRSTPLVIQAAELKRVELGAGKASSRAESIPAASWRFPIERSIAKRRRAQKMGTLYMWVKLVEDAEPGVVSNGFVIPEGSHRSDIVALRLRKES